MGTFKYLIILVMKKCLPNTQSKRFPIILILILKFSLFKLYFPRINGLENLKTYKLNI